MLLSILYSRYTSYLAFLVVTTGSAKSALPIAAQYPDNHMAYLSKPLENFYPRINALLKLSALWALSKLIRGLLRNLKVSTVLSNT